MHAEQASSAKAKRDKACNARTSANDERAALQSQSTAAYAKHLELIKFAEEKEAQSKSRSITSMVQKEDCLAKEEASKSANENAKE
jgi:hypothetical protein